MSEMDTAAVLGEKFDEKMGSVEQFEPLADVVIGSDAAEVAQAKAFVSDLEAVKMLCAKNSGCCPNLSRHGYRSVKRLFDIVFSGAALAVLLIPAAVLCIAICIDSPGASPIYTQHRVGRLKKDGSFRIFRMFKFRSMVPNAHGMVAQLQDKNEADGPLFKIKEDPRVTRIGKFIRRHSLDETPQFLNVFVGQMTLVGPRPPLPNEVIAYDEKTMQRLTVKPGCGGIWQTTLRSQGTFEDMVDMDLEYIEKCGVVEDLRLIAHTAQVVVTGRGAY